MESSESMQQHDSTGDRRGVEDVSRSPSDISRDLARDISRDLARDISRDLARELSREQGADNDKHSQLMPEQQQESIAAQTIMQASVPPLQQHIIKEEVSYYHLRYKMFV